MASFWTKLAFAPIRPILAPLRKKLDYSEYGGSPLLGLNSLCTICHGRSDAKAIMNALKVTERALDNGLIGKMKDAIGPIEIAPALG